MKPLPFLEVCRRLGKAGFEEVGQTGSHVKFARIVEQGTLTTIVPKHREVSAGTLRSILRQAFMSEKEFGTLGKK